MVIKDMQNKQIQIFNEMINLLKKSLHIYVMNINYMNMEK